MKPGWEVASLVLGPAAGQGGDRLCPSTEGCHGHPGAGGRGALPAHAQLCFLTPPPPPPAPYFPSKRGESGGRQSRLRCRAVGGLPKIQPFLWVTERDLGASGLGYALGIAERVGASAPPKTTPLANRKLKTHPRSRFRPPWKRARPAWPCAGTWRRNAAEKNECLGFDHVGWAGGLQTTISPAKSEPARHNCGGAAGTRACSPGLSRG